MSQHAPMHQQILTKVLTAFNQYGNALTMDQLAAHLSVPPSSLSPYFRNKTELVTQLVSFILTRIRQPPLPFSHRSLADELRDLLATYHELFTTFSQTALLDLKLHYPEEWGSIMERRESQWQRIATTINLGIASGQLRPVDINLMRMMVDGMLLIPFYQESPSLGESLDILLFGIARRTP